MRINFAQVRRRRARDYVGALMISFCIFSAIIDWIFGDAPAGSGQIRATEDVDGYTIG